MGPLCRGPVWMPITPKKGPFCTPIHTLGLAFASVSTFAFIGSMLAGYPIWAPPGFVTNWRAFQSARRGKGGWNRNALEA
jgi:hypothetical protein